LPSSLGVWTAFFEDLSSSSAVETAFFEDLSGPAEADGDLRPQVPEEDSTVRERDFEGEEVDEELGPTDTADGDCDRMSGVVECCAFEPAHRLAEKRSKVICTE
jgi:hypothetical protein